MGRALGARGRVGAGDERQASLGGAKLSMGRVLGARGSVGAGDAWNDSLEREKLSIGRALRARGGGGYAIFSCMGPGVSVKRPLLEVDSIGRRDC